MRLLQLNYRDAKPIYEQIKEGVRRLLLSRAIAEDEKLPSVREMAASLAINPNTIQRAYRELEAEGYVYTRKGKGTFAASPAAPVRKARERELFAAFDEAVEELLFLEAKKEDLVLRIEQIEGELQTERGRQGPGTGQESQAEQPARGHLTAGKGGRDD